MPRTVRQRPPAPDQFARTLRLDTLEKAAFEAAAKEIAGNYTANKSLMSTPEFRNSPGELFDPTFVSIYSSYVVPPPANEPGQPDRSTELVCRNVILSLLGDNVNIIHMFLLKLLRSCKSSVGPAYAVKSMKNALLRTTGYDIVFQVRLEEIHNLVDDDDSEWPSSSSDMEDDGDDDSSIGSIQTTIDDDVYDPDKDDESYAGLSISLELSDAFFKSSSSSIEEFFKQINSITDPNAKVNALVGSVVGFLISQVGESGHPDFANQPSVNLVCADIIDGIAGSGQALILIFLMSSLMKGFARVCLELAGNVMNIAGLCLYSKFFKVDYGRLLHFFHNGTLFYDPGNLPMSMEFSEIHAVLQQQNPHIALTLDNALNYIIWLCTSSPNKHPLCSIGMVPIQVQFGPNLVNITNAQREAAATQFMIYLVETIGTCITNGADTPWRDSKKFKELIASAVRNAIALEATLYNGADKVPPDAASALRSKYFCDKLKQAVLVDPGRFTKVNCWIGPDPDKEVFDLNSHCILIKPTTSQELASLHSELNVYLTAIASKHGPATKAAREKKRIADDAAAAASGKPPKLSAIDLRKQRLEMRNEKKAKAVLAATSAETTPLAGHAHALSGFSSAPDFQQQMQPSFAGIASPAFAGIASPPQRSQPSRPPSKSMNSLAIQAIQKEKDRGLQRQTSAKGKEKPKPVDQNRLSRMLEQQKRESGMKYGGGKKQTKNKRNKNKPKTKRRAANKKNKKAHAGRVSRHNKVFRRKTRRSK